MPQQRHIHIQRKEKTASEKNERELQQELLRIELAASRANESDLSGGVSVTKTTLKNLPVPSIGNTYEHNKPPVPTNLPIPPPPDPRILFNMMIPPPPDPNMLLQMMNAQNVQTMPSEQPVVPAQIQNKQKPNQQNAKKKKNKKKKKDKQKPGVEGPNKHMTKEEAYYNDPNYFFYENDDDDQEDENNEESTKDVEEQQQEEEENVEDSPPRKKYKKTMSEQEHIAIRNEIPKQNVDQNTGFGQWEEVDTEEIPESTYFETTQEEEKKEEPVTVTPIKQEEQKSEAPVADLSGPPRFTGFSMQIKKK
ncbi:hypothetical protein AKO1_015026 [Acrasis kona]|uniref:Uncharacterized protein n=1 Tax=Acrasis kona TaxID=1008807 RepID=A0AAW2ZHF9_9EUKA